MNKKQYEKQQKQEKVKNILKWVACGVGWTALLGCFIGLLVLGVRGCSNKNKSSNTTEFVAVTTTPLGKLNISQSEMTNYHNYKCKGQRNLYTGSYTHGSVNTSGQVYAYGGFITRYENGVEIQSIGFDYVKIYTNYAITYPSGLQYTDGNVYVSYLNSSQSSVLDSNMNFNYWAGGQTKDCSFSANNISQGDIVSLNVDISSISNSSFQFYLGAMFEVYQPLSNVIYSSDINPSINLILNRTYFQSIAITNDLNGIYQGRVVYQSDNSRYAYMNAQYYNGFYNNGVNVFYLNNYSDGLPSYIEYEVFKGWADYGNDICYCSIVVSLQLYQHYNSNSPAFYNNVYYIKGVLIYDYTNDIDDYFYYLDTLGTYNYGINGKFEGFENQVYTTRWSHLNVYQFDNGNGALNKTYNINAYQGGTYVKPYLDSTILSVNYETSTKLIFNNDSFDGGGSSSGGDSGTGVYGNVFDLLASAFTSIASILNVQVLPGITIGTLLFLPLVVTVVIFIIWLVKR